MTAIPKISVIIPVFNVEKYLRNCLDSVVNQTLRDIQIICVNDGSTDGSLAILREYEIRDSRIEVIDKSNGGQSSARNVGIERVRGKYMYFLDSDDWIDPTLCEKTYYRLESTGADVVFFAHHEVPEKGQEMHVSDNLLFYCRFPTASRQASEFIDFYCVPWNRVIRTSFFQRLGIRFPEVFLPEDLYMHWVLLVNEPRVELIPEKFYFYRIRGDATTGRGEKGRASEYMGKSCQAFSLVKNYLRSIGKYEQYRTLLLTEKFNEFAHYRLHKESDPHPDATRWLLETLDDEEEDFLRRDKGLRSSARDLVLYLLGDKSLYWKCLWHTFNSRYLRRIIKPIEMFVKSLGKQKRKNVSELELRVREISEQLSERDKVIVHLRQHRELLERHVA